MGGGNFAGAGENILVGNAGILRKAVSNTSDDYCAITICLVERRAD